MEGIMRERERELFALNEKQIDANLEIKQLLKTQNRIAPLELRMHHWNLMRPMKLRKAAQEKLWFPLLTS